MRAFIAIEIPENIKEKISKILDGVKKRYDLPLKWVRKENYHITLHFLGEISDEKVDRIKEIFIKINKEIINYKMKLDSCGMFPLSGTPKVLWIGFNENTGNMKETYTVLTDRLTSFGLKTERRDFKPHITIARCKNITKQHLTEFSNMVSEINSSLVSITEEFHINSLILFQSKLTSGGAIYSKIAEKRG